MLIARVGESRITLRDEVGQASRKRIRFSGVGSGPGQGPGATLRFSF